jgi:hypothetical protein
MSKIPNPWQCDICSTPKKPSNGWFVALIEFPKTESERVVIMKWNDSLAEQEGVSHICGLDCASRWLVKELAKIYGN